MKDMKKIIFLFSLLFLIILSGCRQNISPSVMTTIQNKNTETATTIISGLRQTYSQLGYEVGTSTPMPALWWVDKSGIAVNIDPKETLSIDINRNNDLDSSNYSLAIAMLPEVEKAIAPINDYMQSHNFVLQTGQSTNSQNPNIETYVYTQAFYSSNLGVRCRLSIYDPNLGEGETAPYIFTASMSCMDNQEYQSAYDKQSPFLIGLSKELDVKDINVINNNYPQICENDPAITIINILHLSGYDSYHAMTYKNGGWVDSGMSGEEMYAHCNMVSKKQK